jgi:hypothetical protein
MPSPEKPSWLELAACSEKHITNVLRVLAARESKRYTARALSQQRQLDSSESIPILKPPSALAAFLRREPDVQQHHVEHYSVATGVHEENRRMNRYLDIIPYDRTRVIVEEDKDYPQERAGKLDGRYLNANWVMERFGHKWWIATQAPLRNTAHTFLSVMLQPVVRPPHADPPKSKTTRIRTVVQLTQNFESGRKKADPYFPSEVGKFHVVPPEEGCYTPALKVTLLDQRVFKKAHCVQSTVSISPYHHPAQRASKESRRRGSGQTDQDQLELRMLEKKLFSDICSIYHGQTMVSQSQRIETVSSNSSNSSTTPIATNLIAQSIHLPLQIIYAQSLTLTHQSLLAVLPA